MIDMEDYENFDFKDEPENMGKDIITLIIGVAVVCYTFYVFTK